MAHMPRLSRAIEDMAYPTPEVLYCCGIVMSRWFPGEKGFIPVFLRMLRDMLSLKQLDLSGNKFSGNQVSDAGAASLAAALPTSKLTELGLSYNQISAAGKAQLRQAAKKGEVEVYVW